MGARRWLQGPGDVLRQWASGIRAAGASGAPVVPRPVAGAACSYRGIVSGVRSGAGRCLVIKAWIIAVATALANCCI